jgi:hypothetical protein
MLVIKIQLIPFGSLPAKSFWLAEIWNDATGSHSIGNYKFRFYRKNSTTTVWKGGEIKDFQRLRWSVWYLLYLCLKTIYGDET